MKRSKMIVFEDANRDQAIEKMSSLFPNAIMNDMGDAIEWGYKGLEEEDSWLQIGWWDFEHKKLEYDAKGLSN